MKRFFALILVVLLTVFAAGCGENGQQEVDVSALASALAQQVEFEAPMKELTAEQLSNYLTLPEGAKAAAYMSNGTTAEEVMAVQCADSSEAAAVKSAIESFLSDQRAEMERYLPEEVARLENAVLAQKGSCVVLCVTADTDTAESIIKEYLG
ncbi:MAG: DUF4358 domain-containing protein [Oscillospiraceae bacterium]|nr:DUF4358 domain-containing protein [Oscillospiraceae bacterium]